MQPVDFDYVRVGHLERAIELLAERGPSAKLLAGGQSLLPILGMRLARPDLLIDIARFQEMRHVEVDVDGVHIGAAVTHAELERGDQVALARAKLPLLGEAARLIGHIPIRTRGTIGGSLAHADPSAEWVLIARLLDAVVTVRSCRGTREVAAGDFFRGFLTSDLAFDEIVVGVRFSDIPQRAQILEFSRRHGDFPVVSVAVALSLDDDQRCSEVRIALGGVADVPVRISTLEQQLLGSRMTPEDIADAACAVSDDLEPVTDVHGSREHRLQLSRVLTRRALTAVAIQSEEQSLE